MTASHDREPPLAAELEVALAGPRTLAVAAHKLLDLAGSKVQAVSQNVQVPAGLARPLVYRIITVRTQEAFASLLALVDRDLSHHARVLLRPMVEDRFFLGWLDSLDELTADEFIRRRALVDILAGYEAQQRFLPEAYAGLGVPVVPPSAAGMRLGLNTDAVTKANSALRELGRRHGWGKKGPTVRMMAEAGDRGEEYDFFYLASSVAVHANLHEMGKMVWGESSTMVMTIGSRQLAPVHEKFALIYGTWIYDRLMAELATHLEPLKEPIQSRDWSVWLALVLAGAARNGQLPPIIDEAELEWP